uniref:Uncharacterized protein n=1 Tax=Cacopsylla melanoneura TaxID=428564 RepID=A0A8D9DV32_9HEMI
MRFGPHKAKIYPGETLPHKHLLTIPLVGGPWEIPFHHCAGVCLNLGMSYADDRKGSRLFCFPMFSFLIQPDIQNTLSSRSFDKSVEEINTNIQKFTFKSWYSNIEMDQNETTRTR